ncbi:MAG: alpha-ribazole phosphatase [Actinomycetota bacterium]
MRLYLIRHGETKYNKIHKFIGRTDIELSPKGILQAEALSSYLRMKPIKSIYSSDMLRARQTAEIIARPHGLKVLLRENLREIDFGDWEGKTYDEIEALDGQKVREWVSSPQDVIIPGGESWQDFKTRVIYTVNRIIDEEKDGDVVLVTHGGPIKLLISYFLRDDHDFFKSFWPSTGSLHIVDLSHQEPKVVLLNEVCYKK